MGIDKDLNVCPGVAINPALKTQSSSENRAHDGDIAIKTTMNYDYL